MKFYTHIELNKNQIKDVVIDTHATLPATGAEGQFIYLKSGTVDDGLYVYNGTAWKPVAFGTTFYPIFPPEKTTPEAADFIPGDTLLRDNTTAPVSDQGIWICKEKHSVTTSTTWAADKGKWALLESNTFKGAYAASTNYASGDIVSWGNAAYMCHTACASPTDISAGPDPTKWYLLGANYRGTYSGDIWPSTAPTTATTKNILRGDIVSQGGITYLCKTGYSFTYDPAATPATPYPPTFESANYIALGGGDAYKGVYDTSTTYAKGDVVYYENQLFHCKVDGTTGTWAPANWDLLISDDWRGAFVATGSAKTADYIPGEKVSYNGDLYVCITATDNAAWDPTKWTSIATNIEFFDSAAARTYKAGTLVKTGAPGAVTGVYVAAEDIAVAASAGFDPTQWHSLYNDYRLTWTYKNAYKIGDEVEYNGGYYIAIADQAASATAVDFDASKWYKLGNAQYRGEVTKTDATTGVVTVTVALEYGDIFKDHEGNIVEATAQIAKDTAIAATGSGTTPAAKYQNYTNLKYVVAQKKTTNLQNTSTTAGTAAITDIITIPYGCVIEKVETEIITEDASTTPKTVTKLPVVIDKLYTEERATSPVTGAKVQFTAQLYTDGSSPSTGTKITCAVYYR